MGIASVERTKNFCVKHKKPILFGLAATAVAAYAIKYVFDQRKLLAIKELVTTGSPLAPDQVRRLILSDARGWVSSYLSSVPDADMGRLLEVSEKIGQMEKLLLVDDFLFSNPVGSSNWNLADWHNYIDNLPSWKWPSESLAVVRRYDGLVPRCTPLALEDLPVLDAFARGELTWPQAVRTVYEQVEELGYECRQLRGNWSDSVSQVVDVAFTGADQVGEFLDDPRLYHLMEMLPTELNPQVIQAAREARANWFPSAQNIGDLTLARVAHAGLIAEDRGYSELLCRVFDRVGPQSLEWSGAQWERWTHQVLSNPRDSLCQILSEQTNDTWTLPTDNFIRALWTKEVNLSWRNVIFTTNCNRGQKEAWLRHVLDALTPEEQSLFNRFVRFSA
jgi:hypothetical protein